MRDVQRKLVEMTTNADRIARYKRRMKACGFRRVAFWLHPDLAELLERERRLDECNGRTLERLILGEARCRPGERRGEIMDPIKEGPAVRSRLK